MNAYHNEFEGEVVDVEGHGGAVVVQHRGRLVQLAAHLMRH